MVVFLLYVKNFGLEFNPNKSMIEYFKILHKKMVAHQHEGQSDHYCVTRVTPQVTFHHTAPVTCNTVPVTVYPAPGITKSN